MWREATRMEGDVRFVCEGTGERFGAHACILRSENQSMETPAGKDILVPRPIGPAAVNLVLEFMYLERWGWGSGGDHGAVAVDVREVWAFAELFGLERVQKSLVGLVDHRNVYSAFEFSMASPSSREQLKAACEKLAARGGCGALDKARAEDLKGVGTAAARGLIRARMAGEGSKADAVQTCFEFAAKWLEGNGGQEGGRKGECSSMVKELELSSLSISVLKQVVEPSGIIGPEIM